MIRLFFDIETIPSAANQKNHHVQILKKKKSLVVGKNDEEIHALTSFDGTFGQICCIGVIKENSNGEIILREVFDGTEKEILKKFWETSADVDQFIGHNIWAFDLPFIYKRSIIHGVRVRNLSFARYRNVPIYDTMMEWDLWNMERGRAQKLDTLAHVLDLPTSKDEMDGSMVWKYYQEGRMGDISKYCMKDVELTRKVYYKMNFLTDTTVDKQEELF